MLRRDFLGYSAAVASLASAAWSSSCQQKVQGVQRKSEDPLRVAIIGSNGRGKTLAIDFSKLSDVVVKTICDVDLHVAESAAQSAERRQGSKPEIVQDMRRVLDDQSIDAVVIATPDHWHALAAIWACQAGKHVFLEKPVAHSIQEGQLILEAARKYNRIVQIGHHNRSNPTAREAMEFLHNGGIGKIWMARGLCYKYRESIGSQPDCAVPEGVDYNLWLGPAPERAFNPLRFHYTWRWFWDYGNTDLGAQGVHQLDIARWGMQKDELPTEISCSGGKFLWQDDQETPNCQVATFQYPDTTQIVFEVRALATNDEQGARIGNIFYGDKGYMVMGLIEREGWKVYMGDKNELTESHEQEGPLTLPQNFVEAVKANDKNILTCDIENANFSTDLVHLGNIAYRVNRKLRFDPATMAFLGDEEANVYLKRQYRVGFELPKI